MSNTISPCLWFWQEDGKIASILAYYQLVFGENFRAFSITPLGETPDGNAEMCEVELFKQRYLFMCTSQEHHAFNDAISLILSCKNQEEIDYFWEYLTHEGEEAPCGWCLDKYGLRWQIIPQNMPILMQQPNANNIMMQQKKIVISEYFQ